MFVVCAAASAVAWSTPLESSSSMLPSGAMRAVRSRRPPPRAAIFFIDGVQWRLIREVGVLIGVGV